VSVSGSAPASARTATWKTVAASGRVEALATGGAAVWKRVSRGDELAPRTTMRTADGARATMTRGANILILDSRSEVELPATAMATVSSVVQTSGTVVYEVDRRSGGRFEVVTPYLVAGVKGTVFTVTVGDGRAEVTVEEGVVEVTAGEYERLDLGAGEGAAVDIADGGRLERAVGREMNEMHAERLSRARRAVARAESRGEAPHRDADGMRAGRDGNGPADAAEVDVADGMPGPTTEFDRAVYDLQEREAEDARERDEMARPEPVDDPEVDDPGLPDPSDPNDDGGDGANSDGTNRGPGRSTRSGSDPQ
jgi:hypothetical protein